MLSKDIEILLTAFKKSDFDGCQVDPQIQQSCIILLRDFVIQARGLEAALKANPQRLTLAHLADGNISLFPVAPRPVPVAANGDFDGGDAA